MNQAQRDPRLPAATYRIQLTKDFTFKQALDLVPYWQSLGVSDLYAAPFLAARAGSVHGYDVVDPRRVNPEIGSEEDLGRLHEALAKAEMGLLIDIVPNHVCVASNDNPWWNDVLENGRASRYARYFDIDWSPPKVELRDKVLLPVLGDQYGKVLENGDLKLGLHDGALAVSYYDRRFPVSPASYATVLDGVVTRLRARPDDENGLAKRVEEVALAARNLRGSGGMPADAPAARQNIKDRLRDLASSSPQAKAALDAELSDINGRKGEPRSFDRLEKLLAEQSYRLSFWRVAAEQINYRRFFDINDLAAIRIEESEVLDAVHAKAFELIGRGWVTGLRVDHVDGLRDPHAYLEQLSARTGGLYVVVEKILGVDERLPRAWATEGTTGYEFLNILNGIFVNRSGERGLRAVYDQFRTVGGSFADILYESKRLILQLSLASELAVLARRLDRISEQHRWSRDFTLGTLQSALSDVIACFPVYRTYLSPGEDRSPQVMREVQVALSSARRRNPAVSGSVFEFLGEVLLGRDPEGLTEMERVERRDFVARFQQLTGPVMAKGLEDTSFYRYFPLLSLNEVGGGPERFGLSTDEFHRAMEERARERPAGLSGTSTHDTKRGEDSRARLDVLSEIPDEWGNAVAKWRDIASRMKPRVDGAPAPDSDDEYYIYQTLVGAWPNAAPDSPELDGFVPRAQQAVEKALREAKRNTSWIDPNAPYEDAAKQLVARILDRKGPMFGEMSTFVERIRLPGMLSSLSQLVVKATAPGVPDFFQGTELWDLSMVDPDNRRPVDFAARRAMLDEVTRRGEGGDRARLVAALLAAPLDGKIKLAVTATLLRARQRERELYARGAYLPLAAEGRRKDNVVAFARRWNRRVAITAVGRFFTQLPVQPVGQAWAETHLTLPAELPVGELTDELTGRTLRAADGALPVGEVFSTLPFAVLIGDAELPQGRSEP
jgi:(1->4)-alpha-D-glucan 1-alpha-D-glucosylmutase